MHRPIKKINILYVLIDIVLITICMYLPYILRYNRLSDQELISLPFIWNGLNLPSLGGYSLAFLFWGIITILLLNNQGLYGTDRELSIFDETYLVFKTLFFAFLPAATAVFLLKLEVYSRQVFVLNLLLMIVTLSAWRAVKRLLLRRLIARGYNNLHVLIIGAGKIAKRVVKELESRPYLGLQIVGYLDDSKDKGEKIENYEVLGKTSEFEDVIKQRFVDETFITIPSAREKAAELVMKGQRLGVSVRIIPDLFNMSMTGIRMHNIGPLPILEYHSKGIHGTDLAIKRTMDIFSSLIGLLLLTPFFLTIALIIKLTSRGPVFYRSKRCGKKGRVFTFYKFRSMVKDADNILGTLKDKNEKDGPIFKIRKDPRVTRVGRFMRKLSIDELPQLWNVLKGDMSLVGPRPPTQEEVEKYEDWQLKRLEIKPGITCLWQIRGRSKLSFKEWVELDIYYIEHWSLLSDLKILFQTIPVVLRGKGAY